MKKLLSILLLISFTCMTTDAQLLRLNKLKSPILFRGNANTAYRDPAVLYQNGTFYLFFTLVEIEPDSLVYMYMATSRSNDLVHWATPRKLTAKDQNLDFSSPGDIIRFGNEWLLCLQTYPRPGCK